MACHVNTSDQNKSEPPFAPFDGASEGHVKTPDKLVFLRGAGNGDRTRGLLLGKETLYH